ERFEADFRFALARLREYGEQVALLRGEKAEKENLDNRFGAIVRNYFDIVFRQLKLTTFTQSFFQASAVVPYIIVAPYYFLDKLTLGQMSQTAGAFGRVEGAMSFFIARYASLAAYKAVVDRLTTFGDAIRRAASLGDGQEAGEGKPAARLESASSGGPDLRLSGLSLSLPDGREIVGADSFVLQGGVSTLMNGPSGSGKSTMFRAIAGIWPYGSGRIEMPVKADGSPVHLMLLPQRPYVASGTLKRAASYPALESAYSDEDVRQALVNARLPQFAKRLHDEDTWGQRLSGGEQQRLSIAHALLAKPDWLFLDEATSALDEKLEADIYAMLKRELPQTTIVSIGHRSTLRTMHDRRAELEPGAADVFTPKYV
ncbi:MAG: ABC transporter ATP-binding protein/permease, partial [Alphaproteobacteria bacterium]|nr:ABC transporter ATP-binding protein/permease [Alphaproteobacteria bacterium]